MNHKIDQTANKLPVESDIKDVPGIYFRRLSVVAQIALLNFTVWIIVGAILMQGNPAFSPLSQSELSVLVNAIQRLIVSISSVLIWFVAISLGLWILAVKNPRIRYLFFTLPLFKGLYALVKPLPLIETPTEGIPIAALQFTDFLQIVSVTWQWPYIWLSWEFAIILILGAGFILWRAATLIAFLRLLRNAPEPNREEFPTLFAIMDSLVAKYRMKQPRVIFVNSPEIPFSVGIWHPTIVISQALIEHLNDDELEATLAHEFAHIASRDLLFHWPIVIARDLMFFNPIMHEMYRKISYEKERAADQQGAELTSGLTMAKALVKLVDVRRMEMAKPAFLRERKVAAARQDARSIRSSSRAIGLAKLANAYFTRVFPLAPAAGLRGGLPPGVAEKLNDSIGAQSLLPWRMSLARRIDELLELEQSWQLPRLQQITVWATYIALIFIDITIRVVLADGLIFLT